MQKGKFIVVEGLDGSGKTTLIENIVNSLDRIISVKSLIDTLPRGKCIRECIGNKEHYGNDLSIALLYLSETTRVKDIIEEYLKNGVDVIVDRWFYSTMAYTNNKYIDIIDNVSKYLPNIDMTIYVDVDIDTIVKRLSNKYDNVITNDYDKRVQLTLKQCGEEFLKSKSKTSSVKTMSKYTQCMDYLYVYFGENTKLSKLSVQNASRFRTFLIDVPKNYKKQDDLKNKDIKLLIENNSKLLLKYEKQIPTTIDEVIKRVKTIFT